MSKSKLTIKFSERDKKDLHLEDEVHLRFKFGIEDRAHQVKEFLIVDTVVRLLGERVKTVADNARQVGVLGERRFVDRFAQLLARRRSRAQTKVVEKAFEEGLEFVVHEAVVDFRPIVLQKDQFAFRFRMRVRGGRDGRNHCSLKDVGL